jgi:hypothetical protein
VIFRLIFWSIVIGTLTVGTDGFSYSVAGEEHRLISEENPVFETSQHVVSGLTELKEFCDENQHICHIGAAATSLFMNGAEWTKSKLDTWLYDNYQDALPDGFTPPNMRAVHSTREAIEARQ